MHKQLRSSGVLNRILVPSNLRPNLLSTRYLVPAFARVASLSRNVWFISSFFFLFFFFVLLFFVGVVFLLLFFLLLFFCCCFFFFFFGGGGGGFRNKTLLLIKFFGHVWFITQIGLLKTFFYNPLTSEFLKWTLPSLNLDTYIVANRGFSQKSITIANSEDPDETGSYEPSYLDLHFLQRYLY